MTKDEFKTIFNNVIKDFNTNHDVEVGIVLVDRRTGEAKVHMNLCPYHSFNAVSALSRAAFDYLQEQLQEAGHAVAEEMNGQMEDFLRRVPRNPEEKGS